jgi:predicted lipoprotein with Yx(FWY)xxD motif
MLAAILLLLTFGTAAFGGASASLSDTATLTKATGTRIIVSGSQFGPMLYDSRKQAIYVFARDAKNKSNCYGDCAKLWPPVYTKATPRAGKDVKAPLLGTTKRKNGRLQVTYAGRPLYFYAHEGPTQVRCHNITLNGGIWKVVAPSGKPRK